MEWGERKIKDKFEKTQRLGAWWWVTKECHKIKWLSEEMIEVQNAMWNVWKFCFWIKKWTNKIKLIIYDQRNFLPLKDDVMIMWRHDVIIT